MLTRISTFPAWTDEAICAQSDPEKWFPDHFKLEVTPMRICQTCPVQLTCARYALETQPEHGVWAGTPVRAFAHIYKTFHNKNTEQQEKAINEVIALGRQLLREEIAGRETTKQRERDHKAIKRQEYKARKKAAA